MGGGMGHVSLWWGDGWRNLRDRDHLGSIGIDERIILKWILKKWAGGCGLD